MEIKAIGQSLSASYNKKDSIQSVVPLARSLSGVSFQGAGNFSNLGKKSLLSLRRLSQFMKDPSEATNAFIAAIGTGIIAPFIIMVSPGKGDTEDKNKKFFQAIRQPLSAGLALSFQLPATYMVNRFIDKRAYVDKGKFYKDEILGDMVPDKKYLRRNISNDELNKYYDKFDEVMDGKSKSLHEELKAKIRQEYSEVNLTVGDDELEKMVNDSKRKKNFILDKIAEDKHESLIREKIAANKTQLLASIKDDKMLVTEDYRELAKQRNKAAYDAIELKPELKLSWWDKTIRAMGFSNSKTEALKKAQKAFTQEKGLEILKEEGVLNDETAKLEKFVKTRIEDAKKIFDNKKFWLSLLVNLFMVTASCYALNWAHPRLKDFIDKHKNGQKQAPEGEKVEVNA